MPHMSPMYWFALLLVLNIFMIVFYAHLSLSQSLDLNGLLETESPAYHDKWPWLEH